MTLSEKISEMLNYQPEEKKESGDIYKAIEILNKTREESDVKKNLTTEVNKSYTKQEYIKGNGKRKAYIRIRTYEGIEGVKNNFNGKQHKELKYDMPMHDNFNYSKIKNLKNTSDEEFSDYIDSVIKGDHKNVPALIKVNGFKGKLQHQLHLSSTSVFVIHKKIFHINPSRKKSYNQDLRPEEMKMIPNYIRNANYALYDVKNKSFIILAKDLQNEDKVNYLAFTRDKNGIYFLTAGKRDKISFGSGEYKIVGEGVEPSIHGFLARPITTLSVSPTNNESIPQSINKSIDSQKKNKKITTTKRLLKPIPSTKCAGEEFYFKAHRELNEKYVEYYDDLTSRIYDYLCDQLDLPKCNVITKAIARYKGQILYTPETGKPIDEKELQKLVEGLTRLLNQNRKVGENMIKESQVLGKIIEKLLAGKKLRELKNIPLEELKVSNKTYSTILNDPDKYLNTWDKINYKLMRQSACERLQNMDDNIKHQVKQILFDGVVARESKSKISQRLFDKLGAENRNWRRIVDTEINNNLNRSYIEAVTSQAAEGEKVYFQRLEVVDSRTCEFCREKNGEVVLFSNTPLEDDKINDTYARKAIWSGKTWTGENNTLAEGIFHPNCRGVWVKWNPSYNMEL